MTLISMQFRPATTHRGFTLAEMAIVVLIMGILMTMGTKMLTANLNSSAYSQTVAKQDRIKIALINYLRTNGRLPCPEVVTSPVAAGYGQQGQAAPPNGACTAPAGAVRPVLPWVDLQLSRDDVVDGWGNFFTYRVANTTNAIAWTSRTINPFDINQLTTSTTVFTVQERNGASPTTITTKAVAVIVSHGPNGYGARTVKGSANSASSGADEITNATNASTTFMRGAATEDTTATGGAFDDVVTYMTPQDLLQPLVSEKTLSSCYGYCSAAATPPPGPGCSATAIPVGKSSATCS